MTTARTVVAALAVTAAMLTVPATAQAASRPTPKAPAHTSTWTRGTTTPATIVLRAPGRSPVKSTWTRCRVLNLGHGWTATRCHHGTVTR